MNTNNHFIVLGNHPVCIGPGILHKRKLQSSYKNLPLMMTKYQTGISGVLVYGTDCETNMFGAFNKAFADAYHLRCDIHFKENIKQKMSELACKKRIRWKS